MRMKTSATAMGILRAVDFEERIALTKRCYELMNRGEHEGLLVDLWAEDIVVADPSRPDASSADGLWRGHDGCRRYSADWVEAFDESSFEPEQFFEAGEGLVVRSLGRARAHASGIEVENRRFHALRFRDGRVVWFGVHEDLDEALADASQPAERPS